MYPIVPTALNFQNYHSLKSNSSLFLKCSRVLRTLIENRTQMKLIIQIFAVNQF